MSGQTVSYTTCALLASSILGLIFIAWISFRAKSYLPPKRKSVFVVRMRTALALTAFDVNLGPDPITMYCMSTRSVYSVRRADGQLQAFMLVRPAVGDYVYDLESRTVYEVLESRLFVHESNVSVDSLCMYADDAGSIYTRFGRHKSLAIFKH